MGSFHTSWCVSHGVTPLRCKASISRGVPGDERDVEEVVVWPIRLKRKPCMLETNRVHHQDVGKIRRALKGRFQSDSVCAEEARSNTSSWCPGLFVTAPARRRYRRSSIFTRNLPVYVYK